jgi:signal transduction histidine kinase/CheY-like chemotaxis protein
MLAPIYRETLEKFYLRVYRDQRAVRVGSVGVLALLTAYVGVWPPVGAVLWATLYVVSEFALVIWWRRVQPRLRLADRAAITRLETELIAICAVSCAICAIPCLLTPFSSHDNQILGAMLSAAILLVAAAEHSLRKSMFLATAPAAAIALLWNLFSLGHGVSAWIFVFIGLCYVVNARTLQLSNARVFLDLVKLRADAEAATRAKSDFLATMSHEIRTPLNGVLGMAQIMLRGDLGPEQREQLKVIAGSGQALQSVLNGVLDLAKVESGKLELEQHGFDLEETLRLAAGAFSAAAAQKHIGFRVETPPEVLGAWRGDAAKLGQVVSNLVSNALKFTDQGEVVLSVEPAPGGLTFEVRDSGIGVAADKLALIFERFTQADASTTRRFGGTGLGLAICRELVALMGGELTVRSQLGLGSVFAFTLPLTRDAETAAAASADAGPDIAEGLRILAAEDNPTNRLILSAILTPLGAELTLVCDGAKAVEAFAAGAFDLVLMDVQMPRMDGIEATAAIRRLEREAGLLPTPVIALTANVMRHQIAAYRAAGMDDHVAKPIGIADLVRAIAAATSAPRLAAPPALAAV